MHTGIEKRDYFTGACIDDFGPIGLAEIAGNAKKGKILDTIRPVLAGRNNVIDVKLGALKSGVHSADFATCSRSFMHNANRCSSRLADAGFLPSSPGACARTSDI